MEKTYTARPSDITKRWLVIDADGLVVGRLAALIASLLRGKHKPTFTPHMDMGDYVVVTNVEKVVFTGKKLKDKTYYRHTGYPGGIKEARAGTILQGSFPERVLEAAVRRMLPGGPLSRKQMTHLRLYKGAEHPHAPQNPEFFDVKSMNVKNTLRGQIA